MMQPLAIDLCCGLGGWSEALLDAGYYVVGFDIERHVYGEHRYPGQLVVQDVLTLHGSQFRDAALIVASPPCQFFSYTAMPWSRAKALGAEVRADPVRLERELALFNACFRIQREACEAAGRHVPLIVENVRGAQPWVGRSRWVWGSFHLWGDVPALMPHTRSAKLTGGKMPDGRWSGLAHVEGAVSWRNRQAVLDGRKAFPGGADGWFGDYSAMKEGIKQRGSGRDWFAGDGKISRMTSSDSPARKAASAMIAKIPAPLAQWIARAYFPRSEAA